jgi:hypothetical protein
MLFSFAVVKPLALVFWLRDSAACQPMAVAHGIELSETLVVTEHAVPLAPFAGESENLSHSASFSSALCSSDNRKATPMPERGHHRTQATDSFVWK